MRLFVGIDIDPEIRERLAQFRAEMKALVPGVRWVGVDTFHVTLKFIGERSPQQAEHIKRALAEIKARPTVISFRGTGFFPNARSARVFWAGIEADAQLASLAKRVDEVLASLHIPREEKPYTPHLTLARGGESRHPRGGSGRPSAKAGDRPNSLFAPIQQKLEADPPGEFGTMTASEFFLYESKLSPAGAHYTKIARFALEVAEPSPA